MSLRVLLKQLMSDGTLLDNKERFCLESKDDETSRVADKRRAERARQI